MIKNQLVCPVCGMINDHAETIFKKDNETKHRLKCKYCDSVYGAYTKIKIEKTIITYCLEEEEIMGCQYYAKSILFENGNIFIYIKCSCGDSIKKIKIDTDFLNKLLDYLNERDRYIEWLIEKDEKERNVKNEYDGIKNEKVEESKINIYKKMWNQLKACHKQVKFLDKEKEMSYMKDIEDRFLKGKL